MLIVVQEGNYIYPDRKIKKNHNKPVLTVKLEF
jgi:hypothetical protein